MINVVDDILMMIERERAITMIDITFCFQDAFDIVGAGYILGCGGSSSVVGGHATTVIHWNVYDVTCRSRGVDVTIYLPHGVSGIFSTDYVFICSGSSSVVGGHAATTIDWDLYVNTTYWTRVVGAIFYLRDVFGIPNGGGHAWKCSRSSSIGRMIRRRATSIRVPPSLYSITYRTRVPCHARRFVGHHRHGSSGRRLHLSLPLHQMSSRPY
mmetsp:Transcript_25506/g.55104  ORF Transcript_25506/g.55104 Transcript_25506/m.55104 type:complete len:212 (-) Transcript_25506:602-1237(-)